MRVLHIILSGRWELTVHVGCCTGVFLDMVASHDTTAAGDRRALGPLRPFLKLASTSFLFDIFDYKIKCFHARRCVPTFPSLNPLAPPHQPRRTDGQMKVVVGKSDAVLDSVARKWRKHPSAWLGPFYAGTILDFYFTGILFCQVWSYYRSSSKDSAWIKRLVALSFLASIAKTIVSFIVIWEKNIVGFGDWRVAVTISWGIWIEVPAASVISAIPQTFFIWRCFTLTGRNWYLLTVLIVVQLNVIAMSVVIGFYYAYDPYHKGPNHTLAAPMLISSVVLDLIITSVVSRKLFRSRHGFSSQTSTAVRRLLAITLESAAPPTLNQVVSVIVLVTMSNRNSLHAMFNMLMPRLYVFSFMYTLNSRTNIRMHSLTETSPSQNYSHRGDATGRKSSTAPNVISLSTTSKKDRTTWGSMPEFVRAGTVDQAFENPSTQSALLRHGVELQKVSTNADPNGNSRYPDGLGSARWDDHDTGMELPELGHISSITPAYST